MISYVGTFVLVHGFSALLPSIPDDEVSYYQIMGVNDNCSQEEVRKAYKKLSLRLHPDKVAQRGEDPEQARVQYEKVQQAYAVLSSPNKRRRYDLLHKSPTQYQFVSTGMNPGAMYENLQKASFCDKSRLVFLALLLCCLMLLQPILICAKINQDLRGQGILRETTWMIVLIPWWLAYGFFCLLQLGAFLFTKQALFFLSFVEHVSWFVGMIFLALRWDNSIDWDYKVVFIPIYLALFFKWTHKILRLRQIQSALQRMVTLEYLEQHVLQGGRTYQDLTQEEIQDLSQRYVVVHVPPSAASLTEEEERVQASPEYEHAVDTYTELMNSLIAGVVINTTFVALVVAKVDGAITASWWVVFVPLWVSLGVQILASLYTCCCMPTIGDEVVGGNVEEEDVESLDETNKQGGDGYEDCKADPSFDSVEGSVKHKQSVRTKEPAASTVASTTTNKANASTTHNATKTDATASSSTPNDSTPSEGKEEESKQPDVVEEIPNTPNTNSGGEEEWSGIHIDDEMFHEFESAYQEAEESAMEAQAKSQANCCSAVFQLMILCLLVGKLQQDYMRGTNESVGYNAFWILFPIFLVFGCALCTCACLIYTAGESEGFDHLVERATHKEDQDEENAGEEKQGNTADGYTPPDETSGGASKTDAVEESKQEIEEVKEPDSEMHDLD